MKKTALGIIHNHEPNREIQLTKTADFLIGKTGNLKSRKYQFHDGLIIEANQNSFAINKWNQLFVSLLQFTTYAKSSYLRYGFTKTFYTKVFFREFDAILESLIRLDSNSRYRQFCIDKELTAKHFRIYNTFLNSGHDYLIVIESDALLTSTSEKDFEYILHDFQSRENSKFIGSYCDLAGGFELKDIYGQRFSEMKLDKLFLTHDVSFVNTTCAYMVNRKFVELLVKYVRRHPFSKNLAIDTLINKFLHSKAGKNITCLHPLHLPFRHGSQLEKT